MTITGYRSNRDYTETLAWDVAADGTVSCDHAAPGCCAACVEADERLTPHSNGTVTATFRWYEEVSGRTVRMDTSRPRV